MINSIQIGTLDRKVDIIGTVGITDLETHLTTAGPKILFKNIWARVEPLRGREYIEQYKDKTEQFVKITIRYRKGITEDMVVKYKAQSFNIYAVIDPYMAHVKLELMCSVKKRGKP